MKPATPTLERAFEIARTGNCTSVTHIRNQLAREGYRDGAVQLKIGAVADQLRWLMAERRKRTARLS